MEMGYTAGGQEMMIRWCQILGADDAEKVSPDGGRDEEKKCGVVVQRRGRTSNEPRGKSRDGPHKAARVRAARCVLLRCVLSRCFLLTKDGRKNERDPWSGC